jgi:hypothetical protein
MAILAEFRVKCLEVPFPTSVVAFSQHHTSSDATSIELSQPIGTIEQGVVANQLIRDSFGRDTMGVYWRGVYGWEKHRLTDAQARLWGKCRQPQVSKPRFPCGSHGADETLKRNEAQAPERRKKVVDTERSIGSLPNY